MKTEKIRWQSSWNLWYVAIDEHCLSLWNTEAQSVVALLGKEAGCGGAQINLELPLTYNEYKQLWVVSYLLRLPGLSQNWSNLPSDISPFWIGSRTSITWLQLFWKRTEYLSLAYLPSNFSLHQAFRAENSMAHCFLWNTPFRPYAV